MSWYCALGAVRYHFPDLKSLLAKASPAREGDERAGVAAHSAEQREAACVCLRDLPLRQFLEDPVLPWEDDDVSRLILETHDAAAFAPLSGWTVHQFCRWLLDDDTDGVALAKLANGLTPEMVAAASKLLTNHELLLVASKIRVITRFRNTQGLRGHVSVRLQPDYPTDCLHGLAAPVLDGLAKGCGDAMIGIKPRTRSLSGQTFLLHVLDEIIARHGIPTQSCLFTDLPSQMEARRLHAPLDLVFQTLSGTERANRNLGADRGVLAEARQAALAAKRCPSQAQVVYFQTGQGTGLCPFTRHGLDQQTIEARAYAVARAFDPFLVNTVIGRNGSTYLANTKQRVRAGLEDIFCGKLLGLPMGADVCCTDGNHEDMDILLAMLGLAGSQSLTRLPCDTEVGRPKPLSLAEDDHQLRKILGLRPAPEFEDWLFEMGIFDDVNRMAPHGRSTGLSISPWLHKLAAIQAS